MLWLRTWCSVTSNQRTLQSDNLELSVGILNNTVRSQFIAVDFLHTHSVRVRYVCLLWDPSLTEVLPSHFMDYVRYYVWYRVRWYRDISRVCSIKLIICCWIESADEFCLWQVWLCYVILILRSFTRCRLKFFSNTVLTSDHKLPLYQVDMFN